jgi:hypothetical protein
MRNGELMERSLKPRLFGEEVQPIAGSLDVCRHDPLREWHEAWDAFDKLLNHAANRILLHKIAHCWYAAGLQFMRSIRQFHDQFVIKKTNRL